jgi:hypothetical protein
MACMHMQELQGCQIKQLDLPCDASSRGRTEGGEAAAAATGATPEEGAASIPSDMEQPTAEPGQGRTQHEERAAQVAERVEAAKLRLRAALQARQPEAAKAEVCCPRCGALPLCIPACP